MPRSLVIVAALALGAISAAAQDTASILLKLAAERYTKARSFHFVAAESTLTQAGDQSRKSSMAVVTARDAGGRMRIEVDDRASATVGVFDGSGAWIYAPNLGAYSRAASLEQALGVGSKFSALAQRYLERYNSIDQRVLRAAIVTQEALGTSAGRMQCQVVQAEYSPPPGMAGGDIERTLWISERTLLVLKERSVASMIQPSGGDRVQLTQTITFQTAEIDEPIDAEVFSFTPPEGAREVASLDRAQSDADADKRPAPAFTLKDLDGRQVALEKLRGKVVLLDFWATWCGPCRYDMPFVDELFSEHAAAGLEVYGVNSEPQQQARGYLAENGFDFPTLADPNAEVHRLFQVRAIPTFVVIDRQGRVSAYLTGSRSKQELAAALRAAGL